MACFFLFFFLHRRFGFPNREALEEGQTGQAARGEEHEVVVVWSITSGKRQIVMDGKEVHYSSSRTGVLDHSWTSRGNHVYKVVCHAAPPVSAVPGFRQYDLFIDGQSFFQFPKVYELGLRGERRGRSAGSTAAPAGVKAPRTPREEEEELQKAIRASLAESKQHLEKSKPPPAPAPVPVPAYASPAPAYAAAPPAALPGYPDDSMSVGMGDPTQPSYAPFSQAPPAYGAPPPAYGAAPPVSYPTSNAGAAAYPALPPSAPAPAPYSAPTPAYAPAPAPIPESNALFDNNYSSAPPAPAATPFDSFAPGAVAEDPFAPKPPSHTDIATGIMSAYGPATPAPAPAALPPSESSGVEAPPPASPAMMKFEEEAPQNPFDAALKNLVNIDHIDQPASSHLKSAIKKEEEEKEKLKKKGTSKGLPPAAANVVGHQATLSQIGEVKEKKEPSKPVMNAPPQLFSPQAVQAGAMVVYGDTSNNNGPPPLQRQGFGVGAMQQQQQAYYQAPPQYGAPPPQYGGGF